MLKTIEDIRKNGVELNSIYCGDCLEILKEIPDNFIDTLITDPPYGLSDHKPEKIIKVLKEWLSGNDSVVPDGKGFMGKEWDAFVPPPAIWKECYRVLKPGATMLVFTGTRSMDLMGLSIRLAGFKINDSIDWIYGEGMPKAYDIAKGIDAKIKIGKSNPKGINQSELSKNTGKKVVRLQPNCGILGEKRFVLKNENANLETPEAKLWYGYKSHGLKPAHEPIIMAMKPNDGSYAENALKWGVAGLNIDGGRIEYKSENDKLQATPQGKCTSNIAKGARPDVNMEGRFEFERPEQKGRFPANIILDNSKEVEECFPNAKGSPKKWKRVKSNQFQGIFGERRGKELMTGYGDSGSASSFFFKAEWTEQDIKSIYYCAKANRKERGEFNFHPTVKPLKLMEYLCNLTKTPTGGIVLDPFAGSGTTGMACKKTGRKYILIEKEKKYCEIAEKRIQVIPDNLFN